MSARDTLLLLGLLFIGPLTVGEARAGAIQCGATLGPGGTFVLDADLTCPRDPSPASPPALRVVDAVLDLNGHTLSCADGGDGITLEAAAVVNGTVNGCARGVFIDSSHNVVSRVTIVGIGRFDDDDGLGDAGVFVKSGSGNLIIDSSASRNGGAGFASDAGATFIDNTADVTVRGHQVDLVDEYRDCATTLWKNGRTTPSTHDLGCVSTETGFCSPRPGPASHAGPRRPLICAVRDDQVIKALPYAPLRLARLPVHLTRRQAAEGPVGLGGDEAPLGQHGGPVLVQKVEVHGRAGRQPNSSKLTASSSPTILPFTSTSQSSLIWKLDTRGTERWKRRRLTQLSTSVSK